jgi:hypothetical protein
MNRCNTHHKQAPRRRTLQCLLGLPLLALSLAASAQFGARPFPANAERGNLVVTMPPELQLNGRPDRLSPGARIRDKNNMLALSGSLIGQPLVVNFVRNPLGEVQDVWILTPVEAALKLPAKP